jgi:hypothetical protein
MDEASRRGGFFSGQVGVIKPTSTQAVQEYLTFSTAHNGRMTVSVRSTPRTTNSSRRVTTYDLDLTGEAAGSSVAEIPAGGSQRLRAQLGGFICSALSSYWVGLLPLAIIGGLSQFHKGSSTKAQRVWTMVWLAISVFLGPSVALLEIKKGLVVLFYVGAPAIGGFVVIAQMMMEYGNCVRLY